MKKIILIIFLNLICISAKSQQVTHTITEVKVNDVAIPNGSAIQFGNNSSVVVKFRVTITKPSNLSIGNVTLGINTYTPFGFTQLWLV